MLWNFKERCSLNSIKVPIFAYLRYESFQNRVLFQNNSCLRKFLRRKVIKNLEKRRKALFSFLSLAKKCLCEWYFHIEIFIVLSLPFSEGELEKVLNKSRLRCIGSVQHWKKSCRISTKFTFTLTGQDKHVNQLKHFWTSWILKSCTLSVLSGRFESV